MLSNRLTTCAKLAHSKPMPSAWRRENDHCWQKAMIVLKSAAITKPTQKGWRMENREYQCRYCSNGDQAKFEIKTKHGFWGNRLFVTCQRCGKQWTEKPTMYLRGDNQEKRRGYFWKASTAWAFLTRTQCKYSVASLRQWNLCNLRCQIFVTPEWKPGLMLKRSERSGVKGKFACEVIIEFQ